MEALHRKSCFVIAPIGVELAPFLEALRKNRFEPFFISDFLTSREKPASRVRTAFRSADFVIALLFSKCSLENVYFELGVALGLAKPAIVFADHGVSLPESFKGIEVHYRNLADLPSLISIVEQSLLPKPTSNFSARSAGAGYPKPRLNNDLVPSRQKLLAAIDALKKDQGSLFGPNAPERLEARLFDLFASAGLTAAMAPAAVRRQARGPDLALWVDDVQKEIGNPIAIEIKSQLREHEIGDAVSRLAESLDLIGAKAGILLHTNKDLRIPHHVYQAAPLIFVISVQDLLALLENDTFGSVLKRFRNTIG